MAVEVSEGKETFPFEVFFIHHLSELDTVLDEYYGEFDLILLDMPPLVKNEFKILLAGCDGLLIPMLADTVDKDSALDYMLYVDEIKRENEAYLCYGFINRFVNSIKQKDLPAFAKNHGIELFESSVPAVPLVLSMNETYISPYDKIGSNGKNGKQYLEAFVLEFFDKFLK